MPSSHRSRTLCSQARAGFERSEPRGRGGQGPGKPPLRSSAPPRRTSTPRVEGTVAERQDHHIGPQACRADRATCELLPDGTPAHLGTTNTHPAPRTPAPVRTDAGDRADTSGSPAGVGPASDLCDAVVTRTPLGPRMRHRATDGPDLRSGCSSPAIAHLGRRSLIGRQGCGIGSQTYPTVDIGSALGLDDARRCRLTWQSPGDPGWWRSRCLVPALCRSDRPLSRTGYVLVTRDDRCIE